MTDACSFWLSSKNLTKILTCHGNIRDLAVIDTTVKSSLDKERRALNWLLDLGYREVHLEEHWSTQELNFVNDLFQIKFQVSHYDNRMDLWIYEVK